MARTKETGPRKSTNITRHVNVNGITSSTPTTKSSATTAAKSPATQSPAPKTTTQPAELSEKDKQAVKTWLDDATTVFTVATAPVSKKRKRSTAMQTQPDLFEERLSVQYEVKPRDKWECLRRYKKFTVGSESITTGQCIFVKHDEGEDMAMDYSSQWKAKVLEVRALDSEHVYIRVAWLNRPEDLKTGRKAYHGKYELIPTNQMDVVDAMAVNGPCDVVQWDENDDESPALAEDQFFWRQTYDYVGTKTFSDLRKICIDNSPVNPDEMILQCGNESCRKWMHLRCIAEKAAQKADTASTITTGKPPAKKKPRPSESTITISSSSRAQAKAELNGITCEVMIAGQPSGGGGVKPAAETAIEVTDADGEMKVVGVECLFCGTAID